MDIKEIVKHFAFEGEFQCVAEFGTGHINSTFIADFKCAENEKRYVIQRINTSVFKKPDELMKNIFAVTDYLYKEIEKTGGDPERETLHFIKTTDGRNYFESENGDCFRAYAFVKNSVSFDRADTPELFEKSGIAFGKFQNMLGNFPAGILFETIPNFHNTAWRFENEFMPALFSSDDELHASCREEIDFVTSRRGITGILYDMAERGELPLRVTHNDTKLNNVLFDKDTLDALCVIDLDTVMPGLALYDFADSIRFGASTAAEDEADLSKVSLNLEYFRAYARGFLSRAGETLTKAERDNLAFACVVITLECGMRFLTDYLNGNTYFKIDYPTHNLVRAKNQFALVRDMEKKLDEMKAIIAEI